MYRLNLPDGTSWGFGNLVGGSIDLGGGCGGGEDTSGLGVVAGLGETGLTGCTVEAALDGTGLGAGEGLGAAVSTGMGGKPGNGKLKEKVFYFNKFCSLIFTLFFLRRVSNSVHWRPELISGVLYRPPDPWG